MRLMFFSDYWNFDVDSKYLTTIPEKTYGFLDNLIWIGNGKFSLLLAEYS